MGNPGWKQFWSGFSVFNSLSLIWEQAFFVGDMMEVIENPDYQNDDRIAFHKKTGAIIWSRKFFAETAPGKQERFFSRQNHTLGNISNSKMVPLVAIVSAMVVGYWYLQKATVRHSACGRAVFQVIIGNPDTSNQPKFEVIMYIRSFETMYLMSKKVAESQPVLSRQTFREAKSAEGIWETRVF